MFYKDERLALFIDGPNTHAASRSLGFDIDYKLLRAEFARRGKLVRCFYYTAILESDEFNAVRPLVDYLDYNGFSVVTKPAKEFVDREGRRKIKGNMQVEMTIDALALAPTIDHAVLFTGDGDVTPLVMALKRMGVRVSVASSIQARPPMTSDELRRECDNFVEIHALKDVIRRPERNAATADVEAAE